MKEIHKILEVFHNPDIKFSTSNGLLSSHDLFVKHLNKSHREISNVLGTSFAFLERPLNKVSTVYAVRPKVYGIFGPTEPVKTKFKGLSKNAKLLPETLDISKCDLFKCFTNKLCEDNKPLLVENLISGLWNTSKILWVFYVFPSQMVCFVDN